MKSFKKFLKINEACWTGYKQIGTKEKNGRQVPNCVPEEADLDESTIDKNHPIAKEYFDLKKKNLKDLKDMITQRSKISDTSEFRSKEHAASHLIRRIHGDKKVDQVFGFNEEADLDEGKNLTDTKSDWRSDKSATAKNWSHNKLMKVAKHDRSAEKEIKRRIASKEYVFSNEEADLDEASYRDSGYRNMLKASRKADKEADKVRAQQTKASKPKEVKEEVELDEVSQETKDRYAKKAHADYTSAERRYAKAVYRSGGKHYFDPDTPEMEKDAKRMKKRQKGLDMVYKEETDLRITKVYNKFPKKATYAVHSLDRKYYKEFDSMEKAKAHHAEKTGK
jgi:hypothetical protein